MTNSLVKNKTLQDKSKLGVWNYLVSKQKKKKPQNWRSRHQQLLQPPFSPVKVHLWRVPFRCCWSDRSRPRVWAGERRSVRPPPAARRHQTGQNPRGQMSRVQRHVLPPADLLLRLQRIRLVWNKHGHQTDPLIYHISHFFLCCCFFYFLPQGSEQAGLPVQTWVSFSTDANLKPSLTLSQCISSLSSHCLSECNAAIHKKCIDKVIAKCTGSAVNSKETLVRIWLSLRRA